MEHHRVPFHEDATAQAREVVVNLPDWMKTAMESQGVDLTAYRDMVTTATRRDLDTMNRKIYKKGSKMHRMDLFEDLNNDDPQMSNEITRRKQENNSKLSWQSQIFGISPSFDCQGYTCETTGIFFPAYDPQRNAGTASAFRNASADPPTTRTGSSPSHLVSPPITTHAPAQYKQSVYEVEPSRLDRRSRDCSRPNSPLLPDGVHDQNYRTADHLMYSDRMSARHSHSRYRFPEVSTMCYQWLGGLTMEDPEAAEECNDAGPPEHEEDVNEEQGPDGQMSDEEDAFVGGLRELESGLTTSRLSE